MTGHRSTPTIRMHIFSLLQKHKMMQFSVRSFCIAVNEGLRVIFCNNSLCRVSSLLLKDLLASMRQRARILARSGAACIGRCAHFNGLPYVPQPQCGHFSLNCAASSCTLARCIGVPLKNNGAAVHLQKKGGVHFCTPCERK